MGLAKRLLFPYLPSFFRRWLREQRLRHKFKRDFNEFARLQTLSGRKIALQWEDRLPCLNDATSSTPFEKHYLYHLAWAARILQRTRPARHVDVSSALQFACILSAFVPTDYYEFRPVSLGLDGLATAAADLKQLPLRDRSVLSLSCMHVVEHVGLGRYGDALDAEGDLRAISELSRVLATDGNLLLVIPVGVPRVQFNAHRVYSYEQIVASLPGLRLVEFSLITDYDDPAGLVVNASPELARKQSYGCGCFWFQRPRA